MINGSADFGWDASSICSKKSKAGFTLIELIFVLVILGILAVTVVPNFVGVSQVNVRGFHDETLAYLRYAQKTAIAQRRDVCVTFTNSSISLSIYSKNTNIYQYCDMDMNGPRGEIPALASGLSGAAYSMKPPDFVFSSQGIPSYSIGSTELMSIEVQVLGETSKIYIEPTGFVHE